MARTKIDWADITINPITGCRNFGRPDICGDYCYAARMARRLKGRFGYPADDPFRPTFHSDRLQEIIRKRSKTPSMQLEGYPNQGETNALLERLKGKKIRLMVEEVQP